MPCTNCGNDNSADVAFCEQFGWVEGYFRLESRCFTRLEGSSEPMNIHEVTGLGPLRTRL